MRSKHEFRQACRSQYSFYRIQGSELQRVIEENAGVVSTSVTSKTTTLFVAPARGGKVSVKEIKAREMGVEIVPAEQATVWVNDKLDRTTI